MKMHALRRQGSREDLTSRHDVEKSRESWSSETVGKSMGMGGRQVQRYIRLTELIPEILDYADRKSQLKAIYKDNAETIIANCDSQIFLRGAEQSTLKDLNQMLGKETIDMYNTGESRGTSQSYNLNYQKLGHDLMSFDELATMDGDHCIVQVRGVRPFYSEKYDLTQHSNYKLTADYDKKNWFDIEKYLNREMKLKPDDEFEAIDVGE